MDISIAADNAADYLERYGHRKNNFGSVGTGACLLGAVAHANSGKFVGAISEAIPQLVDVPDTNDGFALFNVIDWNNADERKPEEVIQVLRDVATKYRSDEFRSES